MRLAYRLLDFQIFGAPAWLNTERYDIEAKAAKDHPFDVIYSMLQSLLEERLQLKFHRETKEETVYALVVAKSGKLQDTGECDARPATPRPGRWKCGNVATPPGHITGDGITIALLIHVLSESTGRIVLDKTNLTGKYDVDLDFAPEQGQFQAPPSRAPTPLARSQRPFSFHRAPGTARLETGIAKRPGRNSGHRSRRTTFRKLKYAPCDSPPPSVSGCRRVGCRSIFLRPSSMAWSPLAACPFPAPR